MGLSEPDSSAASSVAADSAGRAGVISGAGRCAETSSNKASRSVVSSMQGSIGTGSGIASVAIYKQLMPSFIAIIDRARKF
jgi:hypothetical protein